MLLAGLGPLGVPELLIIAFIVILVFGVGRLPEVGGALGRGIREFRRASKDDDKDDGSTTLSSSEPTAVQAPDAVFCSECGTQNDRAAKFCSSCGHALGAPVT